MRNVKICVLLVCAALSLQVGAKEPELKLISFKEWRMACDQLPSNRELDGNKPGKKLLPIQSFKTFEVVLERFIEQQQKGSLAAVKNWQGEAPDHDLFFNKPRNTTPKRTDPYFPFAEKVMLPADSRVIIQGDQHGDIQSLIKSIDHLQQAGLMEGFKIVDPKVHICFAGDFTDRGAYGTEVVYTLLRLKLANGDQVHLIQGNHEDLRIFSRYGFLEELQYKFGKDLKLEKLLKVYDLLPVVLYIGTKTDYVQVNHGGLEPGFDPRPLLASDTPQRFQLLGEIKRHTFHECNEGWLDLDKESQKLVDKHFKDFTPISQLNPQAIGFLWNDFSVFSDDPDLDWNRSLKFGKNPTKHLLKAFSTPERKLRAVMRAHQHSAAPTALMNRIVASSGVFRHWQKNDHSRHAELRFGKLKPYIDTQPLRSIPDGSVWTFNVAPDSKYGLNCRYDFAAYGIITMREDFADWKMQVVPVR